MNLSEVFIRRPVATTLLMVAIALAGAAAFRLLPVSPLPQVDFPTISVAAQLPGASPDIILIATSTPPRGTSRPPSMRLAAICPPIFRVTQLTAK